MAYQNINGLDEITVLRIRARVQSRRKCPTGVPLAHERTINRKAAKRLEARKADYVSMVSDPKFTSTGYRRPGSVQ